MDIQAHHRERALTVAQHEMGHYVLAKVMGFGTGGVTVELTGFNGSRGASAIYLDQPVSDLDGVVNYLERRVLVLFAGALAEALSPIHIPKKGIDQPKASEIFLGPNLGADDDHSKVREALRLLRNIQHRSQCGEEEVEQQIREIANRLWARASELVERFEDTIVGLAGALSQRLVSGGPLSLSITGSMSESLLSGLPSVKELPRLQP